MMRMTLTEALSLARTMTVALPEASVEKNSAILKQFKRDTTNQQLWVDGAGDFHLRAKGSFWSAFHEKICSVWSSANGMGKTQVNQLIEACPQLKVMEGELQC